MGTRSNTVVVESGHDKPIKLVNLYRQMDGYPSCHGAQLAAFLVDMSLCNGIGSNNSTKKLANGAGCLAAQLVAHFKDGVGQFYIENPSGALDNDYAYIVTLNTFEPGAGINVQVKCGRKELFNGNPHQFSIFCEEDQS